MKKNAMNFFKNGAPKYLRCYYKKRGGVADPYTIVFTHASSFMGDEYRGRVYYVSANGAPDNPMAGFYQHGEAWVWEFCPCGSRVTWWELPERLREPILAEYCEVWGIVPALDHYGNVVAAERRKEKRGEKSDA